MSYLVSGWHRAGITMAFRSPARPIPADAVAPWHTGLGCDEWPSATLAEHPVLSVVISLQQSPHACAHMHAPTCMRPRACAHMHAPTCMSPRA